MGKNDLAELAYEAGKNAYVARAPVEGCPFPEGDDQRAAWLRGYGDELESTPDDSDLRKALKEATS